MMLENSIDLSRVLKKGENEIKLTAVVGNRNLLGPFHCIDEEPGFVGPDTYERFGTWENGKSRYYSEKYAFVKGIL